MTDPLRVVCDRAERADPGFDADELARWPDGARAALERAGILAAAPPSAAVACDSCGVDHVEPVVWADAPGRPRRAFIVCRAVGRVPVDPDRLRRWAVSLPVLARLVADAVGSTGGTTERVPGRVWRLGAVRAGGRVWIGWLVRGLRWADGPGVVESVPELRSPSALVFVPAAVPPAGVWSCDRPPPVVPLGDALALGPDGLACDWAALESVVAPPGRPVGPPAAVFPAPPGTGWEDVALIVEDRHLRVRVGEVVRRFGFAEAGFEDRRRRGVPNRAWAVLTLIARRGGLLALPDGGRTVPASLKQSVSEIRSRLKALLGLHGDPFHPARRGGGYKAGFHVRSGFGASFPTPPGAGWGDVSITEVEPGSVAVAVTAPERGVTRGAAGWEAFEAAGERGGRYALADLGLSGLAAAALVEVLRGSGRVAARPDDPGLLALCGVLSGFLGIGDTPFEYQDQSGIWAARFGAGSRVPPSER